MRTHQSEATRPRAAAASESVCVCVSWRPTSHILSLLNSSYTQSLTTTVHQGGVHCLKHVCVHTTRRCRCLLPPPIVIKNHDDGTKKKPLKTFACRDIYECICRVSNNSCIKTKKRRNTTVIFYFGLRMITDGREEASKEPKTRHWETVIFSSNCKIY